MPEPIRYGFVGTGMMGCEHIANVRHLPDAVAVAGFDPDEGSRRRARKAAGSEDFEVHDSLDDLLARGDLDVAVVSTPNMTHRAVLDRLLPTDLHLLVEKPLCTTAEDCAAVLRAAEGREALVWMGLEYRYMPAIRELLRRVDAGEAGRAHMVAIREHRFPFLHKVGDWNRFSENTGGTLVEKCCHFFDLMNRVVPSVPVRVMASGGQSVNHLDEEYDGRRPDILDNAFVIVDYADGTRGLLDLCMFAEGSAWEQEVSVTGDQGKLVANVPGFMEVSRGREAELIVGSRGPEWPVETAAVPEDPEVVHQGAHHGASFTENLLLCRAIREGGSPEVTLLDGLRSAAVGLAAHRSIDEGRAVGLDELGLPDHVWS